MDNCTFQHNLNYDLLLMLCSHSDKIKQKKKEKKKRKKRLFRNVELMDCFIKLL